MTKHASCPIAKSSLIALLPHKLSSSPLSTIPPPSLRTTDLNILSSIMNEMTSVYLQVQ